MVIEEVSAIQENLEVERACRESAEALATKVRAVVGSRPGGVGQRSSDGEPSCFAWTEELQSFSRPAGLAPGLSGTSSKHRVSARTFT